MNTKTLSTVALIFFIVMIVFNVLSAFGIIGGVSQQEVSDMNWTLITPAGFTFSIWSVIYVLLLIAVIMSILRSENELKKPFLNRFNALFILSCILNVAWNITFNMQMLLVSTIIIFLLLINLCVLTILARENPHMNIIYPLSMGIYNGWVLIATVVNVAATLVNQNWDGFGLSEPFWGIIMTIVSVLIVIGVGLILKNPILPIPISWAFVGIGFELMNLTSHSVNMILAFVAAGILLIYSGFLFSRYGLRRKMTEDERALHKNKGKKDVPVEEPIYEPTPETLEEEVLEHHTDDVNHTPKLDDQTEPLLDELKKKDQENL